MVLHDYFRSGASHRVRIALHLKDLEFTQASHHLRRGEQRAQDYLSLNPQGLVPTLVHDNLVVTQSLAIMEYLDETFPQTRQLLPPNAADRARVRSLSGVIAADTHPLNNLRILSYLEKNLGLPEEDRNAWCRRWLKESFEALEVHLSDGRSGHFCHGDEPTMADACLAPQMLSAKRFGFDMAPFANVTRVANNAAELGAFKLAEPMRQPDAE
ncbi:MAG: maleylacetoacetate isomerase [Mesorhizobium sp.]|nr:MAG: maleylacetoacetate isomerase [Mesorhizobium sp.]RWM58297.1 MAG: maleylacetoacetate isomerase [Mesorhizobium sp.]RWM58909.1 MAG: maleylacetoacetate isomerase [Mesorhizobium sp.]TIO70161.1 MAG: maleylacetoacetate isomerase [Mesorhizobium sp.]TIR40401.1 MAG: maleylacetoacetate isomerase [Mesorhizobium sp.]